MITWHAGRIRFAMTLIVGVLLTSTVALAQTTGTIAGVVKDTSGAVMPGVTVEAASPALIEKVRVAVTDDSGQYKVVDLRPGRYAVTFTLPGFSTVRRDGLDLSAGFTATVSVEMRVGALDETITVTGQSPIVDVQNTRQQITISRDVIDALPSARTFQAISQMVPGSRGAVEVGGSSMDRATTFTVHGSETRDQALVFDGLRTSNMNSAPGANFGIWVNDTAAVQEYSVQTGAQSAEIDTSGIYTNAIPREGGNAISGSLFANYTDGKHFQSDNLRQSLRSAGLTVVDTVNKIWEVAPTLGGPIKKDRLWFYGTFMSRGSALFPPGVYFELNPTNNIFERDLSRPAINKLALKAESVRLTWRATDRHKFGVWGDVQQRCCYLGIGATRTPESSDWFTTGPNAMVHVTWKAPLTNRLLIDAGYGAHPEGWTRVQPPFQVGTPYSITELSTGVTFQAATQYFKERTMQWNTKFNVSYVTGSHNFKVGVQTMDGWRDDLITANRDAAVSTLNGAPTSLRVYTTPYDLKDELKYHIGIFAQDQWTLKRMTLNAGLRFDAVNAQLPAYTAPGGTYIGPRSFKAQGDLPSWSDISPRVGLSYDLFGNGRTAVKASLGRYVASISTGIAYSNNPLQSSVNAATRAWADANGDFVPQESELGPPTPSTFGNPVTTTTYRPDLLKGWGRRGYNWEGNLGVQHELIKGLSVNAQYIRRSFGNFLGGMNTLVGPGDYDPFCVTAPVDTRLPGGGGNQVCGFYDIKPAKFGLQAIVVDSSVKLGAEQHEKYDGFDLTTNMRLKNGITLQGGISTGRSVVDYCDLVKKTGLNTFGGSLIAFQTLFMAYRGSGVPGLSGPSTFGCFTAAPFLMDAKMFAVVPLPLGIQASATFSSVPGSSVVTRRTYTLAEVEGSLGRPLAGGTRTVTLPIVEPNKMFTDRINQVDVRIGKQFRAGRARIRPDLDVYNLLNASPVLATNATYGPVYLRPLSTMQGRLFKVGVNVDF